MSDFLRLLRLMRPHAGWMAAAVALSAVATLSHVALMATSGWFITAMALAGLAGVTMNYFTPAAMIRAFSMIRTAARYGDRVIGHDATLRFVASLRPRLFGWLERGAPATVENLRQGDLLARMRGDIDRLELAFLRVIAPAGAAALVLVLALPWLAWHLPPAGVVVGLFIAGAGVGLPLLLGRATAALARRQGERAAALNARTIEAVEGMAELAVYDPGRIHRRRLIAASDAVLADDRVLAAAAMLSGAAILLFAHLALVVVLVVGLPAVSAGSLAPANLPMLALLAVALFEAVAPLPLAIQSLPAVTAAASRVFALADARPAVAEPATPARPGRPARLTLDAVSYSYPGAAQPALEGLSMDVAPGSRLAVIGASGSGKSTLADLLVKFRSPSAGTIRLGGPTYDALDGADIRKDVVLVAQHDHLFGGTVRDNLLLADPDADEEQLRKACESAQILAFIEAQPDGLDTYVGSHGARLSGGEARRLLIARALLAEPRILILDEPTEGLDAGTEARLLDGLIEGYPQTTLVLLTHRPARLDRMDRIIRLDAGRIVAAGSPDGMKSHLAALVSLR
jgi:ATP-binding cassette subfamily C protein CydC